MTLNQDPKTSTVFCDTDGCTKHITTNDDITEEQAAAVAFALAGSLPALSRRIAAR